MTNQRARCWSRDRCILTCYSCLAQVSSTRFLSGSFVSHIVYYSVDFINSVFDWPAGNSAWAVIGGSCGSRDHAPSASGFYDYQYHRRFIFFSIVKVSGFSGID